MAPITKAIMGIAKKKNHYNIVNQFFDDYAKPSKNKEDTQRSGKTND